MPILDQCQYKYYSGDQPKENGWVGHVARVAEKRNVCKVLLVVKLEGERETTWMV
jgi:hypothetical protein